MTQRVSEAIAWSCKVMLAPDSIFGHPSEVSAKDARVPNAVKHFEEREYLTMAI